jgi:hypothetical protein
MTVYTQTNGAPVEYAYVDGLNPQLPTKVGVAKEPRADRRISYTFPQTLFPIDGGKTLLRLRSAPVLSVDSGTLEFEIEGWGVRMSCADVHDVPRQIARRFLYLFGKSEQRLLSEQERLGWIEVLDRVDANQFSFDRSAPRYNEGVLLQRNPIVVEWSDGKNEKLDAKIGGALMPLDPGDTFSAYVKLGRDNKSLEIDRVMLIAPGEQTRS